MWQILAAGSGALLADVGPGPILGPVLGGSVAVAGVFLSLAIITGGMWLIRRLHHREASGSRRFFWMSLAGTAFFLAFPAGFIGLFEPPLLLFAVVLVVAAVVFVIFGFRSPRRNHVETDAAEPPRD